MSRAVRRMLERQQRRFAAVVRADVETPPVAVDAPSDAPESHQEPIAADPRDEVEPGLSARWIEGVRVVQREQAWTPALVRARLDEAMTTLRIVGGRVGPAGMKSLMPASEITPLSMGELIEQMHDPSLYRTDNHIKIAALSPQISRMDEALRWTWTYLRAHDGPRGVLSVWLKSRASQRRKFSAMCRQRGWPVSTASDAVARAQKLIADGLNKDGVAVR